MRSFPWRECLTIILVGLAYFVLAGLVRAQPLSRADADARAAIAIALALQNPPPSIEPKQNPSPCILFVGIYPRSIGNAPIKSLDRLPDGSTNYVIICPTGAAGEDCYWFKGNVSDRELLRAWEQVTGRRVAVAAPPVVVNC